jgi:hypothetical protein
MSTRPRKRGLHRRFHGETWQRIDQQRRGDPARSASRRLPQIHRGISVTKSPCCRSGGNPILHPSPSGRTIATESTGRKTLEPLAATSALSRNHAVKCHQHTRIVQSVSTLEDFSVARFDSLLVKTADCNSVGFLVVSYVDSTGSARAISQKTTAFQFVCRDTAETWE